jgi:uncharacterized membrane protein
MMSNSNALLRTAITGLITLGAAAVVTPVVAADDHAGMEQCAGVVKAGMNDCATVTNACHGHVEKDSDQMAWIYLPTGSCERIVGARVVHVVDPSPKKS